MKHIDQSAKGADGFGVPGRSSRDDGMTLPYVSIVMPVRNEEQYIERALTAIIQQDYPRDRFEVVIADGMSTDRTREIIQGFQQDTSIPIRVVDNPMKIAPAALNRAIAAASGSVVVRVDGHCVIAREYVRNCVRYLQEGRADCVGGPIETITDSPKAAAIAVAMSSRFGVGNSAFRTVDNDERLVDTVAFPAYHRSVFDLVGGFDEELVRNQDDEFNYRLRRQGGRVLLTPDVRSCYYSRSNFRSLWRQYYQYGFWKIRVLQLHPRQMSLRQFAPFAFVLVTGLLFVASIFSGLARVALAVLLTLYLSTNLIASTLSGYRTDLRMIPKIAVSYAILHTAYGLGFLSGLFYFRNRWSDKGDNKVIAFTAQNAQATHTFGSVNAGSGRLP